MLELKGIYKWVNSGNNRLFLLKDVDLSVQPGEFISIMGPSGSGKSTLLNVIGMLDTFDQGEFTFLHEPVHKLKEKQRSSLYKQYIGFVFQAYHLIDEPTGNLNSKQGEEIMGLFKELNKEGVTIIQVTHSEKNAGYGSRIINLLDGMIQNN